MSASEKKAMGEQKRLPVWLYILALIVPLMGLTMAIIYLRRPQPEFRSITKKCLWVAFLEPFILLVAILAVLFFLTQS
jgi:hypothetical protein